MIVYWVLSRHRSQESWTVFISMDVYTRAWQMLNYNVNLSMKCSIGDHSVEMATLENWMTARSIFQGKEPHPAFTKLQTRLSKRSELFTGVPQSIDNQLSIIISLGYKSLLHLELIVFINISLIIMFWLFACCLLKPAGATG